MTITWNALKQKLLRLEPAPYIQRRRLVSPRPLASMISKVFEQTSLFLKFITGKLSKNPKETKANEGSEALTKSEIASVEQFPGENSMSGVGNLKISSVITGNHVVSGKLGVREELGKIGEGAVRGKENRASAFELSQVSRNQHFDLSCADLNSQSTAKQWPSNFAVDSGLAFSNLHSETYPECSKIEFSRFTPSLLVDSGSQFSKIIPVGDTASTTNSVSHLYMKEFSSLSSPQDTETSSNVEDRSSHQPESAGSEDVEDEGSSQMPRKRQRREAVLPNHAAEYSSTTEDDEPSQIVDSIMVDDGAGTSAMPQNYIPEEPSGDSGDGGSQTETETETESAGEGGDPIGNGGDGDFEGANGGGGGGGGPEPFLIEEWEVLVYINGILYDLIDKHEIGIFDDLLTKVDEIVREEHRKHFSFYGYTLSYRELFEGPNNGVEEEEIFPVGSLVEDPSWITVPWEEFSMRLKAIRVVGVTRLFYPHNGINKAVPTHCLPILAPLREGVIVLEKRPEKVALNVNNNSLLIYFECSRIPDLGALLREVSGILERYVYWDYLRAYGYNISYLSNSMNYELFPTHWTARDWKRFLTALSEIRIEGKKEIFTRLDRERGRLSRAATCDNLHEYVTVNGRRRGYLVRGRHCRGHRY